MLHESHDAAFTEVAERATNLEKNKFDFERCIQQLQANQTKCAAKCKQASERMSNVDEELQSLKLFHAKVEKNNLKISLFLVLRYVLLLPHTTFILSQP